MAAFERAGRHSLEHLVAAEQAFLEANQACPDSARSLLVEVESRLGYLHHKAGQFEEACRVLDHLLKIDPERPVDRALYADALEQIGQYKEAIEQCDRLIQASPHSAALHCNKAMIYALRLGDGPEAVEAARHGEARAGRTDPSLTYAWGKGLAVWGVDKLESGDRDQGLHLLRDAEGKLSALLDDPVFGERAREDRRRIQGWIERAESKTTTEKR